MNKYVEFQYKSLGVEQVAQDRNGFETGLELKDIVCSVCGKRAKEDTLWDFTSFHKKFYCTFCFDKEGAYL